MGNTKGGEEEGELPPFQRVMCSRREASKFLFSFLIQAVADPPRFPRVTPRGEGAQPVPCLTKRPPLGRSNREATTPLCPERGRQGHVPDLPLAAPALHSAGLGPGSPARAGLGLLGWHSPAPLLRYTGSDSPSSYECVFDRPSPSSPLLIVFSTGPKGRVIRPWGPCKALWTALCFRRKLRKACWARRALGCAHVSRCCLWCLVVHRLTKQRYLFRNPVTQFP